MSTTTADKVTCYLPSLCTAVDCCVEVEPLSRSFNVYLHIDPCNYLLRVGIDNFYFNQSLDRYTFGKAFFLTLHFQKMFCHLFKHHFKHINICLKQEKKKYFQWQESYKWGKTMTLHKDLNRKNYITKITAPLICNFWTFHYYRYTINNLVDERMYLVDLKLSVCTESGCEANYTILKDMLLPKQPCSWNTGYIDTSK